MKTMLITEKMSRRDLAAKLSLGGAELTKQIKAMKQAGQLIETRDYIDPARSKKRRQHFCVMAKTLEMEI
jgi:hypothetical protein